MKRVCPLDEEKQAPGIAMKVDDLHYDLQTPGMMIENEEEGRREGR